MTDVLRIALEQREQLQSDIERLDEFIRSAEQLIRGAHPSPRVVEEIEHGGSARLNLLRRGSTVAG